MKGGVWQVEAGAAAKHPTGLTTAPTAELSSPGVSCAKARVYMFLVHTFKRMNPIIGRGGSLTFPGYVQL